MRMVELMTNPPRCLGCGSGNVEDEHRQVGPFVDLMVDVNWGEDAYLCPLCVEKIAVLAGYVQKEDLEDFKVKLKEQTKLRHEAEADRDEAIARARRFTESVKVVKSKGEVAA